MADFVLVHGAWHGAWCWQRVLPHLWSRGHRAFAVSLSGVGERAHRHTPDIRLRTHVDDVLAVLAAEELRGAVLVGHSYAGLVITGVADDLTDVGVLSRLVYLDAVVPLPGECWSSTHSDEVRRMRREDIGRHGMLTPPDPALFGLSGADAAWVARRQTPHPGGVYDDPLPFDPGRVARWPRSFIDCTRPALPTIAMARQRVRADATWRVHELAFGHDPMVQAPDALVDLLVSDAT
jgi:pimeloyl-ACP methyl ester carboxylesterase